MSVFDKITLNYAINTMCKITPNVCTIASNAPQWLYEIEVQTLGHLKHI